ncbi:MAG: fructosamine kinase family protein [Rhizomicrobium sp.]|nr:fructosamine kinase family protein [Rhizomicrobium sp.]
MNALAEQGAALMGGALRHVQPLGGGSLSALVRIVLEDGREAIVKTGPAPLAEARMLKALHDAGVPAPEVYAVNREALVLAELPSEGGVGTVWPDLGAVLRKLHASHGTRYGWEEDYAFGPVAIANRWSEDWPLFWAEHRLLCHLRSVGTSLARRLEHLCSDLYSRLPQRPVPALLHGDLWGGNVLVRGEEVSGLIDPACYYGHSEVDIAMLEMFDHPGAAFFSAYGALEPGHEERLAIYRLWPALVHLRLFGSGYRPLVERFLTELGV